MHLLPSKAMAVFYVQKPYGPGACICGSVLSDGHFGKMLHRNWGPSRDSSAELTISKLQASWAPQKKQAALRSKQLCFTWPITKQASANKGITTRSSISLLYKADRYLLEQTTLGKCLAKSPTSLRHRVLHTTRGKLESMDRRGK